MTHRKLNVNWNVPFGPEAYDEGKSKKKPYEVDKIGMKAYLKEKADKRAEEAKTAGTMEDAKSRSGSQKKGAQTKYGSVKEEGRQ